MKTFFAYTLFVLCVVCLSGCASKESKTIKNIASELNKHCPVKVDYIVTLDKVDFDSPTTIIYYYTANLNLIKSNTEELAEGIKLNLNYSIVHDVQFKALREAGATFKFIYKTQVGKDLLNYTITPDFYAANKAEAKLKLTDDEIYKVLKQSSSIQNSQLPAQILEGIVLYKVEAIAPRTLEYIYHFNNNERNEIDSAYLVSKRVKNDLIATVNAQKDTERLLKDNDVTFRYTYCDKAGVPVASIEVVPGEYY